MRFQMIYPAPTQPPPLDPPKPVPRTIEHTPYPAVTTGAAVASRIAPVGQIYLRAGQTYQLNPVLLDCFENEQRPSPSERFTFRSNSLSVPVSDTGLVITACQPSLVSRRGAGQAATITISYGSTATITSLVEVHVTADFDHVISD